MIKQSYKDLEEPQIAKLTSKIHREAEEAIESNKLKTQREMTPKTLEPAEIAE